MFTRPSPALHLHLPCRCDYPVSDRGNAVQQFFAAAAKDPGMIKGSWIYMIESDYVFIKPLPIPSAESQVGGRGAAWRGVVDWLVG